ncbi:hypothetical protein ABT354_13320 [Streptomyces sp. NPDC000594]|uniref:hypothetical protein n=1 Tax=Streptomyces sp. NPDC000594 TaxID=3154261 RepID=UPI0033272E48
MSVIVPRGSRSALVLLVVLALGTGGCAIDTVEMERGRGADGGRGSWTATAVPALGAFHAAPSVTVGLTVRYGRTPMRATVRTGPDSECRAEVTFDGRGTLRLMRTGDDTVYMMMDEAHIRGGARGHRSPEETEAEVKMFAGRWVKAVPSAPVVKMAAWMCGLRTQIPQASVDVTQIPVPTTVTENGRRFLALAARARGITKEIHITIGKPAVHKLRVTGGDTPFTAVFSQDDKPVGAFHPPAGDVLTAPSDRA